LPSGFDLNDYELSTQDVEKQMSFNELESRRMAEQFDAIFKRGTANRKQASR
jgi:DNA polymerase-1